MENQAQIEETFEVRDSREKSVFLVDSKYFDGYASALGVYVLGVYTALCRHADISQKSNPSQETLARELNISRATVVEAIRILSLLKIIKVQRVGKKITNRYWLLSRKFWKKDLKKVMSTTATSQVMSTTATSLGEINNNRATILRNERNICNTCNTRSNVTFRVTKVTRADKSAIFDFNEYLTKLENSDKRELQVIAFYIKKKELVFDTYPKIQVAIKRHIRAAREVAKFSDAEIVKAYKIAQNEYRDKYTIETVVKLLTK